MITSAWMRASARQEYRVGCHGGNGTEMRTERARLDFAPQQRWTFWYLADLG